MKISKYSLIAIISSLFLLTSCETINNWNPNDNPIENRVKKFNNFLKGTEDKLRDIKKECDLTRERKVWGKCKCREGYKKNNEGKCVLPKCESLSAKSHKALFLKKKYYCEERYCSLLPKNRIGIEPCIPSCRNIKIKDDGYYERDCELTPCSEVPINSRGHYERNCKRKTCPKGFKLIGKKATEEKCIPIRTCKNGYKLTGSDKKGWRCVRNKR